MIRHAGANDSNSPYGKCWETALNTFHKLRSEGGLASIAFTPFQNHNYSFVRYMAIPFYESVLAKRLPTGKSVSFEAMKDIHKSRGWLGDTLLLNTFSYTERIKNRRERSEEHTSELQSLMRISYAVFCLKKKKINKTTT